MKVVPPLKLFFEFLIPLFFLAASFSISRALSSSVIFAHLCSFFVIFFSLLTFSFSLRSFSFFAYSSFLLFCSSGPRLAHHFALLSLFFAFSSSDIFCIFRIDHILFFSLYSGFASRTRHFSRHS